jgi:hypothetical protein
MTPKLGVRVSVGHLLHDVDVEAVSSHAHQIEASAVLP